MIFTKLSNMNIFSCEMYPQQGYNFQKPTLPIPRNVSGEISNFFDSCDQRLAVAISHEGQT